MTLIFGLIALAAILAYVPVVLTVVRRDRILIARRRPINEILADAVAQGRMTYEEFSERMDEVHRAMPTLDMPYPRVRELEDRSL